MLKLKQVRRALVAVTFVTASIVASGCGSSTSPSNSTYDGTYNLTAVNGSALPYNNSGNSIITAGSIVISGNHYTYSLTTKANADATAQTQTISGTYSVNGSTLSYTPTGGSTSTGTLTGTTITLPNDNLTLTYTKATGN